MSPTSADADDLTQCRACTAKEKKKNTHTHTCTCTYTHTYTYTRRFEKCVDSSTRIDVACPLHHTLATLHASAEAHTRRLLPWSTVDVSSTMSDCSVCEIVRYRRDSSASHPPTS